MKLDLLIDQNKFATVLHFSKKLGEALMRLGHEVRLVSTSDLSRCMQDPPDFTFSFHDIRVKGEAFAKTWHVPHLTMLVDPVVFFLEQTRAEGSHVSCVDREDVAFLEAMGFERTFFFPHAVESDAFIEVGGERPIEVALFGSLPDFETLPVDPKVVAEVLAPGGRSFYRAQLETPFEGELLPTLDALDTYIRAKDRVELVRGLEGFDVHVWGDTRWKTYCPNVTLHSPVDFPEALEIMKRSQVVVNSSPRFKHGSHERVFSALACGALPLTSRSSFFEEVFVEREDVVFYDPGAWASVGERLRAALPRREEMVASGQRKVMRGHTWDDRAAQLVEELKESHCVH